MRPLTTGRPILESGGSFPLDRHDMRGDVRHAADDGQLGDRLVEEVATMSRVGRSP